MRGKTRPFTIVTLVCLLLAVGVWIHRAPIDWRPDRPPPPQTFQPGMSISEPQIRKVWEAIGAFDKKNNHRPDTLEMLTAGGYLKPADLLDTRRKETPAITTQPRRFAINPDMLYFPALWAEDPADMVLLCTVLLAEDGGKYHVIFNDGRYAALTSHELVMALNLTYEYIGGKVILTSPDTSQPGR